MAIDLNWILPFLIIVGLIIIVACRVTGQTVGELFRDILGLIKEKQEEGSEMVLGNYER